MMSAGLGRLDRAAQRGLVAGMRDEGRIGGNGLGARDKSFVLAVQCGAGNRGCACDSKVAGHIGQ